MKPIINTRHIAARTVAVFVDGTERARFTSANRDNEAAQWIDTFEASLKPRGGLYDAKPGDKVIEERNGFKTTGEIAHSSNETSIRLKGSSYSLIYRRSDGKQRGGTGRIYQNADEVAAIEAAEAKAHKEQQEQWARESREREAQRKADPRTPYLDNLEQNSQAWHTLTLEQLQTIAGWLDAGK